MAHLFRVLICLVVFGLGSFLYVDQLNQQTALRFQIPAIEKEIEEITQQNVQLAFQLENFNNPQHLLELAKQPEYSHLKFPFMEEVMVISSEIAKRYESTSEEIGPADQRSLVKWPIYLGSSKR
ncbi:MAG: hypothetical protein S4CHLAM6_12490 [Chlamydiae bacterium]|nr:hypothetical protein [Chlamydiota bacterium]